MSQFPVFSKESAPAAARQTLDTVANAFGFVPNLLGVMAASPAAAEAYLALSGIFDKKTSLTPTERQVVLLTVSRYHECHYCMAAHSMISAMQKIPTDIIDAIRLDRPIADEKLEALRRLVTAIVEHRGHPSERELQAFFEAGYTPAQVLDVLVGITQKTLSNYTNHIADTPLDASMEPYAWSPR